MVRAFDHPKDVAAAVIDHHHTQIFFHVVIPQRVGVVEERKVSQDDGVQFFRRKREAGSGRQHAVDAGGAAVSHIQRPANRVVHQRIADRRTVSGVDDRFRRDRLANQAKDFQVAEFGLGDKLIALPDYLLLFLLPALQVRMIFCNGFVQKPVKKRARILADHFRQRLIRVDMLIGKCQVPVSIRLVLPEELLQGFRHQLSSEADQQFRTVCFPVLFLQRGHQQVDVAAKTGMVQV